MEFNAVTDRMIAEGVMSRDEIDSPMGPTRRILKSVKLNNALTVASISNNARAHQMLGVKSYSSRLAISKYLDALRHGLESGDTLVPFVCLRSVIEHVAHFHTGIQTLRPYSVPPTFEEGHKVLSEIYSFLVKATYGTKIDWNLVFDQDVDRPVASQQLKYERDENRADRTARSTMNGIDSLTKVIPGTRAVYDILSEFAHPNVGNLFLFTEMAQPCTDMHGVRRVKKRLSPNVPMPFLKEAAPAVRHIIRHAAQCLQHLESLLADAVKQREKVLEITQVVIRYLISKNRELFDAYASCPCGSEKGTKFCCGRASK